MVRYLHDQEDWLAVGRVVNETDGRLVHLHGLNLSRAWNLRNIARALPDGDPRIPALVECAQSHAHAGLAALSSEDYASTHWIASFAGYLLTDRGVGA